MKIIKQSFIYLKIKVPEIGFKGLFAIYIICILLIYHINLKFIKPIAYVK